MARDRFDAIVLGDGVGALVAAATMATAKARVLWVPHERQTWSFPAGNHRFPVEDGPFVGLGMDAVFPTLAEATGVHLSEHQKFSPLSPPLQVITPSVRMDLPADPEALAAEARREAGVERKDVVAFVTKIDEARKGSAQVIGDAAAGRRTGGEGGKAGLLAAAPAPLAHAARAVAAAMSRREVDGLSSFEAARALGAFRGGVYEGPLGPLTLREMLLDRMRMLNVTSLRERRVARVRTTFGKAAGVILDDGSRHDSDAVVSSLDAGHPALLAGGLFGTKTLPAIGAEAVSETFTLHMIVGKDVLPVGLAPRAVLAGADGSDPILLARHPSNASGLVRISMTRRLPAKAPADARATGMREAFDRVRAVIPFLDDDIRAVFPAIGHARDLSASYGGDPWAHVRGPGVFRPVETAAPFAGPLRGMFRAGADCLPGLGFEGEIAAGAGAARQVLARRKT
ncbi:MAG TPA: hypothetical protein VMV18_12485 [bacterium]|nr:hypothetical protein [bacterium]